MNTMLNHTEAETVGLELSRKWEGMTGHDAPVMNALTWGDVVQFVLRRAREIEVERNGDKSA